MAVEFPTAGEQKACAAMVGTTVEACISGLRVGMNGKPELLGELRQKGGK